MKLPVPLMDPCPVLSSAMKQAGPCTVNVPMGVATLQALVTSVTLKTLLPKPGSAAVMAQVPCMLVDVEFAGWLPLLLLDPQLNNNVPIDSKTNTAISFFITLILLKLWRSLPPRGWEARPEDSVGRGCDANTVLQGRSRVNGTGVPTAPRPGHSKNLPWSRSVGSKLKCPVFEASEMSGFKVEPSPIGLG
jgi:hypothetical protein